MFWQTSFLSAALSLLPISKRKYHDLHPMQYHEPWIGVCVECECVQYGISFLKIYFIVILLSCSSIHIEPMPHKHLLCLLFFFFIVWFFVRWGNFSNKHFQFHFCSSFFLVFCVPHWLLYIGLLRLFSGATVKRQQQNRSNGEKGTDRKWNERIKYNERND